MANLVAIVYPSEAEAKAVVAEIRRLQKEYLIEVADVCYVTRDEKTGAVELHQSINLTGIGAASGALWGTLIGFLFLNPIAGAAIGAGAGALSGYFSDFGISDSFMKELGQKVQYPKAAVFVLYQKVTADKVLPDLAKHGGEVLYTNLSDEAERRIQAALSGEAMPPGAPPAA